MDNVTYHIFDLTSAPPVTGLNTTGKPHDAYDSVGAMKFLIAVCIVYSAAVVLVMCQGMRRRLAKNEPNSQRNERQLEKFFSVAQSFEREERLSELKVLKNRLLDRLPDNNLEYIDEEIEALRKERRGYFHDSGCKDDKKEEGNMFSLSSAIRKTGITVLAPASV